jgi:hypothetical protein
MFFQVETGRWGFQRRLPGEPGGAAPGVERGAGDGRGRRARDGPGGGGARAGACGGRRAGCSLWEEQGIRVLDDSYNANADSTLAALQTLVELRCQGRRMAVLGDMAELGAESVAAHSEIGRRAAELGVDQLIAVGKMAG